MASVQTEIEDLRNLWKVFLFHNPEGPGPLKRLKKAKLIERDPNQGGEFWQGRFSVTEAGRKRIRDAGLDHDPNAETRDALEDFCTRFGSTRTQREIALGFAVRGWIKSTNAVEDDGTFIAWDLSAEGFDALKQMQRDFPNDDERAVREAADRPATLPPPGEIRPDEAAEEVSAAATLLILTDRLEKAEARVAELESRRGPFVEDVFAAAIFSHLLAEGASPEFAGEECWKRVAHAVHWRQYHVRGFTTF